jgi:hypothetical protein
MKPAIKILLAVAFVLFFSCEDQGLFVKCPDCVSDEPVNTNLEVKLDLPASGQVTKVNIYEGNLEDSVLYGSINTTGPNASFSVTINKKYTVTATYYVPDDYYVAVDAATPRVRYDKTHCDNPCYFVYDKNIDLRLKYTR